MISSVNLCSMTFCVNQRNMGVASTFSIAMSPQMLTDVSYNTNRPIPLSRKQDAFTRPLS